MVFSLTLAVARLHAATKSSLLWICNEESKYLRAYVNLEDLLNQGRLRHHKTSKKEIDNLLTLAKRDIKDAKVKGLSSDRRFACAYNAVLQLATILLYCKGFRPKGVGHHFTVFQTMKIIMGGRLSYIG